MSLALTQSLTAIGPNLTSSFLATGGIAPYSYSVLIGGAGGSIDSSGLYTAPNSVPSDPKLVYDTVQVQDAATATATAKILIGSPLLLFCDILQNELGLDSAHVYLWDQKAFQPLDSSMYVVVSVLNCKPFGNNIRYDGSGSGLSAVQEVHMQAMLTLDIISRGPAARDQKELVIAALQSTYSQQQQEANSFYVGKISTGFTNLSMIDGPAIPYRYQIQVAIQYTVTKASPVQYFDTFATPQINVNA